MSDASTIDMNSLVTRIAEEDQRARAAAPGVNAANKVAVLGAMTAAGISRAVVTFDGSGDEGAVRDIQCFCGNAVIDSEPKSCADITLQSVCDWRHSLGNDPVDLVTALEDVTNELIAQTHQGWENNDGGQGEAVFDTGAGTITLNIGLNYISTDEYSYEV
jgi:hypothetical protein